MHSVLALSTSREYYLSLTEKQLRECKNIDNDFYCFHIPIMYVATNNKCGLGPLLGQEKIPEFCNKQYVKITNSIFSHLSNLNAWLYVSINECETMNCKKEDPLNVFLNGTGKITLDVGCKGYARQTVLIPSQSVA